MGLFDTVRFDQPLRVPGWTRAVAETQTKHFGSSMQVYTVGSLLPEAPVLLGVVEESLWCSPEGDNPGRAHPVYFVIWHRILAGVFLDFEKAEERLRTVDRLDLIEWLDEAQKRSQHWEARFQGLYTDVNAWHTHQTETEPATEREALLRGWRPHLPDEILQANDPLASILKLHGQRDQGADSELAD